MDLTTSTLCVVALAIIYKCLTYGPSARFKKMFFAIPGAPSLPLLGNALDFYNKGFDELLRIVQVDWIQKYGPITRWFIGDQYNVLVSSPDYLEKILSSTKYMTKGHHYEYFYPWLGNGLAFSIGQKWKSRRRLLTPTFHFKALEGFVDVYHKHMVTLSTFFDAHCQPPGQYNTVNVFPYLNSFALDVVSDAVMGIEMNAQTKQDNGYSKRLQRITQIIVEKPIKPTQRVDFFFQFTSAGREYKELLNYLHDFTDNVIKQTRLKMLNNNNNNNNEMDEKAMEQQGNNYKMKPDATNKKSIIELLIRAADKSPEEFTDLHIREEIDTFIFAGHDTISSLVSWFFYCMAAYPECQEKVVEELHDVFGDSDRPCTMEDSHQLKYLDCCIKETLRLYPSLPMYEREATEDIQLGEYTIPAGCNICLLIYGLHRNPDLFPNPNAFDPERFFPDQCVGRHPYAYLPFSAGPRNCIGQKFALLEARVILSTLMRRYAFSLSPSEPPPIISFQVITKPMNGVHLVLSRRTMAP